VRSTEAHIYRAPDDDAHLDPADISGPIWARLAARGEIVMTGFVPVIQVFLLRIDKRRWPGLSLRLARP
jgi:hypothetical protein